MIGGIISALVALTALVLHFVYLWPILMRHGSSSAFDAAVGIALALFLATFWSCMYVYLSPRPQKKK